MYLLGVTCLKGDTMSMKTTEIHMDIECSLCEQLIENTNKGYYACDFVHPPGEGGLAPNSEKCVHYCCYNCFRGKKGVRKSMKAKF